VKEAPPQMDVAGYDVNLAPPQSKRGMPSMPEFNPVDIQE
jgi:hypothetical protein